MKPITKGRIAGGRRLKDGHIMIHFLVLCANIQRLIPRPAGPDLQSGPFKRVLTTLEDLKSDPVVPLLNIAKCNKTFSIVAIVSCRAQQVLMRFINNSRFHWIVVDIVHLLTCKLPCC